MQKSPESVVILGAGESGVGAALLAKKLGAAVWVSDAGEIKSSYKKELTDNNIPFEEGKHSLEKFFEAELIIKSPGIPEKAPVMQALRKAAKPVISEIEFAARYTDAPIVAITGSNGKTTTTSLIFHVLKTGGIDAGLGGNIGKSFARMVATKPHALYVLEVSSFQLDDTVGFHPTVAVLLNITADHLDRYDYSMEKYAASKFRIARNQQAKDAFIYCLDDPMTMGELWKHPVKAAPLGFCLKQGTGAMIWMEGKEIVAGYKFRVDYDEMQLKGKHNAYNAMAAILAALRLKVPEAAIQEGLRTFAPIEHRLEPVGQIEGASYLNDSKATNVDAVLYALESVTTPTIWIAGGVDKGNEYGVLDTSSVKALIILGPNKEKLLKAFQEKIPLIREAASMAEAVKIAHELATDGDTVLLSPACASFDLFKNYEDRGRQFKEEVKRIISQLAN